MILTIDLIFDSSYSHLGLSEISITTHISMNSLIGISIICHTFISATKKSGTIYVSPISSKVLENGETNTYI
ncbi:MAG: hypothetical protein Q8S84_08515 [bacterium]|nr:hypothetical protein [bacterium]MDP3381476.1 hypothetical protein [bacterium]